MVIFSTVLLRFEFFTWCWVDPDFFHKVGCCSAGLGADGEPVVYALGVEFDLFVGVFGDGIVPAELFYDATITRGSFVDCVEAIEWAVRSSEPLEA